MTHHLRRVFINFQYEDLNCYRAHLRQLMPELFDFTIPQVVASVTD